MKQKTTLKSIAAILSVILIALSFFACGKDTKEPDTTADAGNGEAVAQPTGLNPLTGLDDLAKSMVGKRPVAIMVENSPEARPQWGLCSPDIVIEGEAEGGITRMMWLFSDVSKAPKIGPTRSARHDYVELAEGLDAIYVHFGGAYSAYDKIKNDKVDEIDGNKADGKYFARESSRKAPHNAYTTGEKLAKAISAKKLRTDVKNAYVTPFKFATAKRSLAGGACNSVTTVFSGSYKHTFTYNTGDGLYYNHMNKNEMKDADGKTMAVTNVLILYTNVSKFQNDAKLVDWDLKGGEGVYISNGTYENITWSKGNAKDTLKLKDSSGNPLELNPGKSWIGFVRSSNQGSTVIA